VLTQQRDERVDRRPVRDRFTHRSAPRALAPGLRQRYRDELPVAHAVMDRYLTDFDSLRKTAAGPQALYQAMVRKYPDHVVSNLLRFAAMGAFAREGDAVRDELTAVNKAWGAARLAYDSAAYERMLTPDFYVLMGGQRVTRQDFIRQVSQRPPGRKARSVRQPDPEPDAGSEQGRVDRGRAREARARAIHWRWQRPGQDVQRLSDAGRLPARGLGVADRVQRGDRIRELDGQNASDSQLVIVSNPSRALSYWITSGISCAICRSINPYRRRSIWKK